MIDFDTLKVGNYILTETTEELLQPEDGNVGKITEVRQEGDEFWIRADFLINDDVPLYKHELIRHVTKEEYPEYYL